jgi:hypothetical protein
MDPTVQGLIKAGWPIRRIDFYQNRALAARYGVDRLPTYLMMGGGQILSRVVGPTTQDQLLSMMRMEPPQAVQAQVSAVVQATPPAPPTPPAATSSAISGPRFSASKPPATCYVDPFTGKQVCTGKPATESSVASSSWKPEVTLPLPQTKSVEQAVTPPSQPPAPVDDSQPPPIPRKRQMAVEDASPPPLPHRTVAAETQPVPDAQPSQPSQPASPQPPAQQPAAPMQAKVETPPEAQPSAGVPPGYGMQPRTIAGNGWVSTSTQWKKAPDRPVPSAPQEQTPPGATPPVHQTFQAPVSKQETERQMAINQNAVDGLVPPAPPTSSEASAPPSVELPSAAKLRLDAGPSASVPLEKRVEDLETAMNGVIQVIDEGNQNVRSAFRKLEERVSKTEEAMSDLAEVIGNARWKKVIGRRFDLTYEGKTLAVIPTENSIMVFDRHVNWTHYRQAYVHNACIAALDDTPDGRQYYRDLVPYDWCYRELGRQISLFLKGAPEPLK